MHTQTEGSWVLQFHFNPRETSRQLFIKFPISDIVKWKGEELEPGTRVELVLKFYPVRKKERHISSKVLSAKILRLKVWQQAYPSHNLYPLPFQIPHTLHSISPISHPQIWQRFELKQMSMNNSKDIKILFLNTWNILQWPCEFLTHFCQHLNTICTVDACPEEG